MPTPALTPSSSSTALSPYATPARRKTSPSQEPAIRKKYRGTVIFAQGECGTLVPIRSHFPTLPSTSAFFEHLQDFVAEKAVASGKVYKFVGTYMLFKNGNPSWRGTVAEVVC